MIHIHEYWKHQHNKSNQFDQIFKIHSSELMTSAHFRILFLKKSFYK